MDRVPTVSLMRKLGLEPDPWQVQVLEGDHPRLLLNCCRQAGKSTVVAVLGLAEALYTVDARVLLVSRSHRQSRELFRIASGFYRRLGAPLKERLTADELELANHSRIVSVPCKEETIRGYSGITTLVIDEAARVPDELYRAVRPMLAVSQGRLICLSTPYGKRGFFHDCWANGGDDWSRIEVPAQEIARIRPEQLAQDLRALGETYFRQEYCCSFEACEGLVYPNFDECVFCVGQTKGHGDRGTRRNAPGDGSSGSLSPCPLVPFSSDRAVPRPGTRRVGGLDFGYHNPFAAVWGALDDDGVLWLTGEYYQRQRSLSEHAQHLPRDVTWYCDPSGPQERIELIRAGFTVRPAINAVRPGIAAVAARVRGGTLRIVDGACPNLLREAEQYRYGTETTERDTEAPVSQNNHALDALRYLVSRLDEGFLARLRRRRLAQDDEGPTPTSATTNEQRHKAYLERETLWNNPNIWNTFS